LGFYFLIGIEKSYNLKIITIILKPVLLMKSLQMQVEFGQKKAMKKVINKGKNLIHCLNLNGDSGVSLNRELQHKKCK